MILIQQWHLGLMFATVIVCGMNKATTCPKHQSSKANAPQICALRQCWDQAFGNNLNLGVQDGLQAKGYCLVTCVPFEHQCHQHNALSQAV